MYIYNVTISIDPDIQQEWLHWMQQEHIPEMLATGKFTSAKLLRVHAEEAGGLTYAVQYTTESKETLQRYYTENADILRAKSKRFEGKFVAFRTELEILSHH